MKLEKLLRVLLFTNMLIIAWDSIEFPGAFIPFHRGTAHSPVRRASWRHCGQGYYVRRRRSSCSVNVTDYISGMLIRSYHGLRSVGNGADYGH